MKQATIPNTTLINKWTPRTSKTTADHDHHGDDDQRQR
jgi:hypothetical protein